MDQVRSLAPTYVIFELTQGKIGVTFIQNKMCHPYLTSFGHQLSLHCPNDDTTAVAHLIFDFSQEALPFPFF